MDAQTEQPPRDNVRNRGRQHLAVASPLPPARDDIVPFAGFVVQRGDVLFGIGFEIARQKNDHRAATVAKAGSHRFGQAKRFAMLKQARERIARGGGLRLVPGRVG